MARASVSGVSAMRAQNSPRGASGEGVAPAGGAPSVPGFGQFGTPGQDQVHRQVAVRRR
jgi:hypothetical protein